MRKIKFGVGGVLMISAMLISDSVRVLAIYLFSAFLHEMGHLLTAKILKIKVKEIKFGFSGVRIVTDERLTSYKNELLLALSGPLVNILVFCGVLGGFIAIGGGAEKLFEAAEEFLVLGEWRIVGVIGFFALSSLIQALMNLLPVNTFDGGRMLYCAIAENFSEHAAERVIEIFSAISVFLLWTVALYLMLKVASGLGIYVFAACIFASTLGNGKQAENDLQ